MFDSFFIIVGLLFGVCIIRGVVDYLWNKPSKWWSRPLVFVISVSVAYISGKTLYFKAFDEIVAFDGRNSFFWLFISVLLFIVLLGSVTMAMAVCFFPSRAEEKT